MQDRDLRIKLMHESANMTADTGWRISSRTETNYDEACLHPFIAACLQGETELKPLPGYHLATITQGVLGEASKIKEECEEFLDAVDQDAKIMALIELADLLGAMTAYLDSHHPGTTIDDLLKMASITERAFRNGHRD